MAMSKHEFACDGYAEAMQKQMTRRAALTAGIAGVAWWAARKTALAQATFGENGNVLVVVFLRGGADGLNIVAPYTEDAYYRLRPTLAIKKPGSGTSALRDLDGFFGLHPSLAALHPIYEEGELAFIHAVGSGDQSRSHFEAMTTMERGADNRRAPQSSGWLARHLATTPSRESPLRAVALSRTVPESLRGATQAIAIRSLDEFRLAGSDDQRKAAEKALADLYQDGDDAFAGAGRDTLQVLKKLGAIDMESYSPENGAIYPGSSLGNGLKQIAILVRQEVGLEIASLDASDRGGWDTHIAQEFLLAMQLQDLGDSLAAFRKDLADDMSRVTVVVQTEFGRRAAENSGYGTDHGRASIMIALGGGVSGGRVIADWPGLEEDQLDGPGDLRVTTDYRDVLAEALSKRLGNARTDEVFPLSSIRPVGVFT